MGEMKYKVGDEVVVVSHDVSNALNKIGFIGKVLEVEEGSIKYQYLVGNGNEEYWFTESKLALTQELVNNKMKVKSDGGSSSYYFSKLPKSVIDEIVDKGGIEIKDIVKYCFYNDADCKDIIKALKRIMEDLRGGGKEGVYAC